MVALEASLIFEHFWFSKVFLLFFLFVVIFINYFTQILIDFNNYFFEYGSEIIFYEMSYK
jgi:hypothetical protein